MISEARRSAVVEVQTGRLLDYIDVHCRSGEQRGDDQRELPCKHDHVFLRWKTRTNGYWVIARSRPGSQVRYLKSTAYEFYHADAHRKTQHDGKGARRERPNWGLA